MDTYLLLSIAPRSIVGVMSIELDNDVCDTGASTVACSFFRVRNGCVGILTLTSELCVIMLTQLMHCLLQEA